VSKRPGRPVRWYSRDGGVMRDGPLVESSPFVGLGKFVAPVAICSFFLADGALPIRCLAHPPLTTLSSFGLTAVEAVAGVARVRLMSPPGGNQSVRCAARLVRGT